MGDTVLIIEDERDLADIAAAYLKVEGIQTVIANDGAEGLAQFKRCQPSVVLLDIMLPKIDGIELCKEIREISNASVIMISAKNSEMDKVLALGIGADDYVTKPFSMIELVARVKTQIRRYKEIGSVAGDKDAGKREAIETGALLLNKSSYEAQAFGQTLNLTTKEFDILYYLAQNPNLVLKKEQIYEAVWGYNEYGDDNSVTVYINRIRDKLEQFHLDYIKTVWGVGYKYYPEQPN